VNAVTEPTTCGTCLVWRLLRFLQAASPVVRLPIQRVPGQAALLSLGVFTLANTFTSSPETGELDQWTISVRDVGVFTVLGAYKPSGEPIVTWPGATLELDRLQDAATAPPAVPSLAVRARLTQLSVAITSDQLTFVANAALDIVELVTRLQRLLAAPLQAQRRPSSAGPDAAKAPANDAASNAVALATLLAVVAPASHLAGADAAAIGAATNIAVEGRDEVLVTLDLDGVVVSLLRAPLPSTGARTASLQPLPELLGAGYVPPEWTPLTALAVGRVRASVRLLATAAVELAASVEHVTLADTRPTFDWVDPTRKTAIPAGLRDLLRLGRYARTRARRRAPEGEKTLTHISCHCVLWEKRCASSVPTDGGPEAASPVALKVKPVPPGIAVSLKRSSDGVMQVELDVGVVRMTLLVDVILALHYFVVPTLEEAAVTYGAMVSALQRATVLQAAIGTSDAQADRDTGADAGETHRASREQVLARAAEAAARHAMAARAAGALTLNVTVGGIEVDLIRDFHSVSSLGNQNVT